MTAMLTVGQRVRRAREAADIAQRDLLARTGITQTTLSRIESGKREAKMNEIVSLAWVLGSSVAELTGHSDVRDRVECIARATDDANMDDIRRELTHYLELDAYLEDQGIPQPK